MNREEFIEACVRMGYCSRKIAKEYSEGKDEFSTEDLVAAHRFSEWKTQDRREHLGTGQRPLGDGRYTTLKYTVYNGHNEH